MQGHQAVQLKKQEVYRVRYRVAISDTFSRDPALSLVDDGPSAGSPGAGLLGAGIRRSLRASCREAAIPSSGLLV